MQKLFEIYVFLSQPSIHENYNGLLFCVDELENVSYIIKIILVFIFSGFKYFLHVSVVENIEIEFTIRYRNFDRSVLGAHGQKRIV